MAKALGFSCLGVFGLLVLVLSLARTSSSSSNLSLEAVRRDQCAELTSSHQSALEATFEIEIRSGDGRDEWHEALNDLGLYALDLDGQPANPTDLVNSVLRQLEQKTWPLAERQRLEYVLLGNAMPLQTRRKFDSVCVTTGL